MISSLSQMLIITAATKITQVPAEPDPKRVTAALPTEPRYRKRCRQCDEEGIDARLPCLGHN
jgi:hypothetical protein